jgi:NAD(P)-dependent dehydrogenase (short-subunit alcohol dehydrogenase family)
MNILKNKIALITGGTSGMGAASAKRFHEEGATVIVTGSSEASAEAARKAMPYVEAIASDAGDPKAAKILAEHVKEKYGRLDILFVNAGIGRIARSPRLMKRTSMSFSASTCVARTSFSSTRSR